MINANITYSYTHADWNQERFLSLGGFTVVFLNYNKLKFIERSVKSALAQDFPLLEMFFMDDASKDGSGDVMERIVREYKGRHKVTVIRNKTNRGITGQWNVVSKLATGNWYGMFCGDDIAHADRVSVSARRIAERPTIKGMCTSGVEHNLLTGAEERRILCDHTTKEIKGDIPLDEWFFRGGPVVGATAFWHKSLFDKSLPCAPLDDLLLFWVLFGKNRGRKESIWFLDSDDETVEYSIGEGVSSEMRMDDSNSVGKVAKWINATNSAKKFASLEKITADGIKHYFNSYCSDLVLRDLANAFAARSGIISCSTIGRILLFPTLIKLLFANRLSKRLRERLLKEYIKKSIQEIFGLRFAGVVHSFLN